MPHQVMKICMRPSDPVVTGEDIDPTMMTPQRWQPVKRAPRRPHSASPHCPRPTRCGRRRGSPNPVFFTSADRKRHEPSRRSPAQRLNVPAYVKHPRLVAWVAEIAALTEAAEVYWCDGSQAEYDRLCEQLVAAGTMHAAQPRASARTASWRAATRATSRASRTAPSSAASSREDAGPTNNWMAPAEMRALLQTGRRRRCSRAACAAARCTWCRSRWARWARTSPTSASS